MKETENFNYKKNPVNTHPNDKNIPNVSIIETYLFSQVNTYVLLDHRPYLGQKGL